MYIIAQLPTDAHCDKFLLTVAARVPEPLGAIPIKPSPLSQYGYNP